MIGIYVLRLGDPPVHEFVRKGEIFRQSNIIMPERRVIHLIECTTMDIGLAVAKRRTVPVHHADTSEGADFYVRTDIKHSDRTIL